MPLDLKNTPPYYTVDTAAPPAIKIYQALLTQTSTNDPSTTIIQNTLGDITWERMATGSYTGTLTGTFLQNKTALQISNNWGYQFQYAIFRATDNYISIETANAGTQADGLLNDTYVNIQIIQ